MFSGLQGPVRYRLRSMACYYGRHYFACVLLPGAKQQPRWVLVDDARLSVVGSWAEMLRKCEEGRIQPSVLLYSRE